MSLPIRKACSLVFPGRYLETLVYKMSGRAYAKTLRKDTVCVTVYYLEAIGDRVVV